MKYELEIYVEGTRLDLFDYESVNLKKSTKDFRDISKVFTSFSRNLTIPASKNNNKVFRHFDNVNIINGSFDGRTLKSAELRLNGSILEKGNVALESVQSTDGQKFSYSIRFYGGLTELKKRIGGDYIHNLDFSDLNIDNPDYSVLLSQILSSNPSIAFVLSSSNRRFIYHSTDRDYVTNANLDEKTVNIAYDNNQSTSAPSANYGVVDNDLSGTIRTKNILDAIESRYNLTLTGAIRADYVEDYRLLLNASSREITAGTMNSYDVTHTNTSFFKTIDAPNWDGNEPLVWGHTDRPIALVASSGILISDNEFPSDVSNVKKLITAQVSDDGGNTTIDKMNRNFRKFRRSFNVCVQTTVAEFEVDVLKSNEVIGTISEAQAKETGVFSNFFGNTDRVFLSSDFGGAGTFSFKVRAKGNGTINISYRFAQSITDYNYGGGESRYLGERASDYSTISVAVSSSGSDFYDVSGNMPKIKVNDFITTLTKQFNLIPEVTINESGTHNIDFKHYDYYIQQGNTIDITDYVDISNSTTKPSNLYSGINFSHLEAKSGMEEAFLKVNNRQYGELEYELQDNESRLTGTTFDMKLKTHRIPTEHLNDLSDGGVSNVTWLQLSDLSNNATSLGPVFLYAARQTQQSISYNNGTNVVNLFNAAFPTNLYYGPNQAFDPDGAICGNFWGAEISQYWRDSRFSGLGNFNCFWSSYIALMFDSRTRKVELEAFLPQGVMLNLKTNDTLLINDRIFLINSYDTNFKTDKTKLELIEITKELKELFEEKTYTYEELNGLAFTNYKIVALTSSGELSIAVQNGDPTIGRAKNIVIS